jgi:pyrroloquinoline quinone biosynthesis protein D
MIGIESTVHLASKARLRFDRLSNKHMLLYPERGLVLSDTAADVVTLCVEARTVVSIVESLVERYGEGQRAAIVADVVELLQELADKGLIREVAR